MRRSKRKAPAATTTTAATTTSDDAACPCVKRLSQMSWRSWQSSHPERKWRERQATSWIEFTRRTTAADDTTTLPSLTGLTQGILRLETHKKLPVHHHPAPFSETYYFLRGNGVVRLGREPLGAAFLSGRPRLTADKAQELEERSCRLVPIEPGLHVDVAHSTLHGMEAGDEGCEFIWTFAAARWCEVPYLYLDSNLPDRNVVAPPPPPAATESGVT